MTSGREIDKQHLIDDLHRVAGKIGDKPTVIDYEEHGNYSPAPYYGRYDSWNEALEDAGIGSEEQDPSREELLEEIHRVADEVGGTPRKRDIEEISEYTFWSYRSEFDSWNNSLKTAGFEPNLNTDITRDDLLEEIKLLHRRLGKVPRGIDMIEKGEFSLSVYYDRFESWNNALRAVGLEPIREYGIPEENLLGEINRLADGDSAPTVQDMSQVGKYSQEPYRERFGSWSNALEAAGYEANIDRGSEGQSGEKPDRDYGYDSSWTKKSYRIRDQDGRCLACNRGPSELDDYKKSLEAHHVANSKEDPVIEVRDIRPARYVTLCPDCHRRWEWIGLGPDVRITRSIGNKEAKD